MNVIREEEEGPAATVYLQLQHFNVIICMYKLERVSPDQRLSTHPFTANFAGDLQRTEHMN